MWTVCVRAAHILAFPSRSLHSAAECCRRAAETWEGSPCSSKYYWPEPVFAFIWWNIHPDMCWFEFLMRQAFQLLLWEAWIYAQVCKSLKNLCESLCWKPLLLSCQDSIRDLSRSVNGIKLTRSLTGFSDFSVRTFRCQASWWTRLVSRLPGVLGHTVQVL